MTAGCHNGIMERPDEIPDEPLEPVDEPDEDNKPEAGELG